jgi:hypothetical protein
MSISVFTKLAARFAILAGLALGMVVFSSPGIVRAQSCQRTCTDNLNACMQNCGEDPPLARKACMNGCNNEFGACLAGC